MSRVQTKSTTLAPHRGMTLVEMMVAMAVAVVLLAVGVPMYQGLVANNRAVTQVNGFVSALRVARSEAVSKMTDVVVCARASNTSCGTDWDNGWLVFVDGGANVGSFSYNATNEYVIRVVGALPTGSTITPSGGATALSFSPTGAASTAENFQLEVDGSSSTQTRCVLVNLQGQVSVRKTTCP